MKHHIVSCDSEAAAAGAHEIAASAGEAFPVLPHVEIITPAVMDENDPLTAVTPAVTGPVRWRFALRTADDAVIPDLGDGVAVSEAAGTDQGLFPEYVPPRVVPVPEIPAEDPVAPVRTETLRRLCMAFGARDQQHLSIKVQDAMMQAGVLTDRLARGVGLTPQEHEKAQWLRRQQALYAHVKAVGNTFEAQAMAGTLAEDFRADQHWMAEEAAT